MHAAAVIRESRRTGVIRPRAMLTSYNEVPDEARMADRPLPSYAPPELVFRPL